MPASADAADVPADEASPPGPGSTPAAPTTTVVIVTLDRPDFVRTCLQHVARQTVTPQQVVVVDSSPGDDTWRIVRQEFPDVEYARNPRGRGATATSRDISLRMATGEIMAFLDDDAFAEPDWLERLLAPYDDPLVGGVGGRILRGPPAEYTPDMPIGIMRPDGAIVTNFDADPGKPVEVDYVQGASMSFRRKWLQAIGGIRDGYPGTCAREESDLCRRVRALGVTIVFTPEAVVDHVAGPYPKGRRFDFRYNYFHQRNHMVFVIRNFGYRDPVFRRSLLATGRLIAGDFRRAVAVARNGAGGGEAARKFAFACVRAPVLAGGALIGINAGRIERRRDRASGRV